MASNPSTQPVSRPVAGPAGGTLPGSNNTVTTMPVPGAGKPTALNPDPSTFLKGAKKDAYAYLFAMFAQWGLQELAPEILKYVQNGYSTDTIAIELRESKAYKKRFAANEARTKAGLPVLEPGEYIAVEDSIRSVMREAGLPIGFYDSPSDFNKLIASGVSPSEVKSRVDNAREYMYQFPGAKQYMDEWYATGGNEGDLLAYALDPSIAAPLVEQRMKAAQLASKVNNISRGTAEQIAANGLTADAINQGAAVIGREYDNTLRLANIDNIGYSVDDLANEVFLNDPLAGTTRKRLASSERARFSAAGGQSATSLTQGSAGSY